MKFPYYKELTIDSLEDRGYGIAYGENKTLYKILNSLPNEKVKAEILKHKRKSRMGRAIDIITPSKYRVTAENTCFIETSPWEIMSWKYENQIKNNMISNLIRPLYKDFTLHDIRFNNKEFGYRNKMEFSFFFSSDNKIHLAFHQRDSSRGKVPVETISLLPKIVNRKLIKFLNFLNSLPELQTSMDLKGLVVRYSFFRKKTVICLFVKSMDFPIKYFKLLKIPLVIIYSNPKSPAFNEDKVLYRNGLLDLQEKIGEHLFSYPYNSFFQINPVLFKEIIEDIIRFIKNLPRHLQLNVIEYYAGIGTIGISISQLVKSVIAVELFSGSQKYALQNAKINNSTNYNFIESNAENIPGLMNAAEILILDPPRSGLHKKIIDAIKKYQPKFIIYLSCNPKTQISDLEQILDIYKLRKYQAYNLYPKTPHIESLALLIKR